MEKGYSTGQHLAGHLPYQDHGIWFARNGYVCLVVDTLQLGEIPGVHHGTYNLGRWWWQARGYTPAGVECWNGVRAIDYLVSRPDVDAERLAVTGISGGGATTIWVAAADERVKCAVPVSGMSDLESYVTNKIINGHCDCMLMINTYQWEWTTIAALIAPRPLLFANSDNAPIFPMDGNRRIIARLRECYKLHGKPELVDDYVSVGGHDYRKDLRVAIFQWINKHIKNDSGPVQDVDQKVYPAEELRVFPEDRDVPKDAINGKVDETFVPPGRVPLPAVAEYAGWRKAQQQKLQDRSFRDFLARHVVPEAVSGSAVGGANGPSHNVLPTERGVKVRLSHFIDEQPEVADYVTLVVLNPGEELGTKAVRPARLSLAKDRLYYLRTRGDSPREWAQQSPPNYVARAHALLGQTVDQGRVLDVIAGARLLNSPFYRGNNPPRRGLRVAGSGQAGILAAYAALFEPAIAEVVVIDPPTSHRDGPTFLNVQKVLDIPEALGLLAPRPLTIVNGRAAFDRTAEIYRLAGAADKLKRQ